MMIASMTLNQQSTFKIDINGIKIEYTWMVYLISIITLLTQVQDFMLDNCRGFESYRDQIESGEGNKLEWMDLFRDYQGVMESILS